MPTIHAIAKPWLGAWLGLTALWGFSFLFIKVCTRFLDPLQTTFGRLALGALVLLSYLVLTGRRPVTQWKATKHLALCALLAQSIPFTLFAWSEHYISSVAAGLVNSTMSLWTGLLAIAILPEEKLNRFRTFGLVLGTIGVMVLLGVWDTTFRGTWLAYLACGLATIGYAIAVLWTKRFVTPLGLDPIGAVATQLVIAATISGVVSLLFSQRPTYWPIEGLFSLFMLGAAGTGLALVLNFVIIHRAGAMASSTVTYSIPIVSTIAGVVILGEAVHWYEPVGAIFILVGIAIVQRLIPRNKPKN